jgi:hypothetical protein
MPFKQDGLFARQAKAMWGYLLLARFSWGDVPLRLCGTEREAVAFADSLTISDVIAEADDVLRLDEALAQDIK